MPRSLTKQKSKRSLSRSRRSRRSRASPVRRKYRSTDEQLSNVAERLRNKTPPGITLERVENPVYVDIHGKGWSYDVVLKCGDTELSIPILFVGLSTIPDENFITDYIQQRMYDTKGSWVPWIVRNFETKLIEDLARNDAQAKKWLLTHSTNLANIPDIPSELADILYRPGGLLVPSVPQGMERTEEARSLDTLCNT